MEKYNGWTNYETWNVALWIDNEEGSYNYWREITGQLKKEREYGSLDREASYYLSEQLKEEICDQSPLARDASCYSDLLGSALANVNWREIAENWLENLEDDE